jgi:hypothetical protein
MHSRSAPSMRGRPQSFLSVAFFVFAVSHGFAESKTRIPKFATFAGIRVGLDTIQTLEKKFGRGLPDLGGHPRGGRDWRVPGKNEFIYADGFNSFDKNGITYAGGRQVDTFWIRKRDDVSGLPNARISDRHLKFMGVVGLGMTRQHALAALSDVLPVPEQSGDDLICRAKGYVFLSRINYPHITTDWKAVLHFENEHLTEIYIATDE